MLPLAWMFRAELYNIVSHEMCLVLPDGFKLLFPNVLHIFIYLFIYLFKELRATANLYFVLLSCYFI